MKIDDLPKFCVETIHYEDKQTVIIGKTNRWEWIGEGYFAFLLIENHTFLKGKIRDVNEKDLRASFIPERSIEKGKIQPKKACPYLDGYWGERAQLVFNNSLKWTKINFKPRDAIKYKEGGSKELNKGGWDHEHCDLCWEKISASENPSFMRSNEDDNICSECFENYVEKQSIDFIG